MAVGQVEYLQDLFDGWLHISDFHISCIGFIYFRQVNGTFGQEIFTIHLPDGQVHSIWNFEACYVIYTQDIPGLLFTNLRSPSNRSLSAVKNSFSSITFSDVEWFRWNANHKGGDIGCTTVKSSTGILDAALFQSWLPFQWLSTSYIARSSTVMISMTQYCQTSNTRHTKCQKCSRLVLQLSLLNPLKSRMKI